MKKHPLNVAILYYGPFPWNRGIGQLYSMVEELGHKPHVFSAYPESRYLFKAKENYRTYHFRSSNSILQKIMAFQIPFNLFWEFWLMKMCRRLEVDFLFVRETPLSYIAQRVAHKLKIPVVLDMRENLPEVYADAGSKKMPIPPFLQYYLASIFESLVLPRFDHMFTVSDELKQFVNKKYAIPVEKISVLGNYPENSYLKAASLCRGRKNRRKPCSVRLVFAGEVAENRGVQDIVAALSLIPENLRPSFTIIGEGSYLGPVTYAVKRFKLDNYVKFLPLLPPEELPSKLSQFDVGVCPYRLNEQTHHTMPGKLFEYMAAGLAVLSSARKPVKRVVEASRCGLIYSSENPQVIANAIRELLEDNILLQDMGRRGRDAIFERYNCATNLNVLESVFEYIPN